MEFIEVIKKRHSVRKYSDKKAKQIIALIYYQIALQVMIKGKLTKC